MNEKLDQCKKGFKLSPFKKGTQSHMDNNYSKQGANVGSGVRVLAHLMGDGITLLKRLNVGVVMDLIYIGIVLTILIGN